MFGNSLLHRSCQPVASNIRSGRSEATRLVQRKLSAATENATGSMATPDASKDFKNVGPEPQRFTVSSGQLFNVLTASAPFLFRLGAGGFNSGYRTSLQNDDGTYGVLKFSGKKVTEESKVGQFKRPAEPLVLYEFQGCPFCYKVREAISILDLDVLVYPCPKAGPTWRPKAAADSGKQQFPYLVDPNTGKAMLESDEIISYLFNEYGDGNVPLMLRLGPLTTITAGLALAPRAGRGSAYRASRVPQQPLTLWGYELSPFVRLVKEVLSELELPYLQKTVSRGSPKRQELLEKRGHFQVPYLEDPNEGVYLFESAAIVKYLEDTYGLKA